MAVPDVGFGAEGIGQADSKLAVLVASAAGTGCRSSDLPRQIANQPRLIIISLGGVSS